MTDIGHECYSNTILDRDEHRLHDLAQALDQNLLRDVSFVDPAARMVQPSREDGIPAAVQLQSPTAAAVKVQENRNRVTRSLLARHLAYPEVAAESLPACFHHHPSTVSREG